MLLKHQLVSSFVSYMLLILSINFLLNLTFSEIEYDKEYDIVLNKIRRLITILRWKVLEGFKEVMMVLDNDPCLRMVHYISMFFNFSFCLKFF